MTQIKTDCLSAAIDSTDFTSTRNSCLFTKLPIPPSSNSQYFLARRGKKTYHIPSDELKKFKREMDEYRYSYSNEYLMNLHKIQGWVKAGTPLEIRCVFFFKKCRIITKDGRPKRLDTSNRIKALHDAIATMMQIDDCWFFRVYAEKVITLDGVTEMSCVEILPTA